MYGLIGKMTAVADQRETLIGYLLQAADGLRSLDGCYLYVISRAAEDPNAIWITEVWASQADHQASLTDESAKALISLARPLIAGMSDRIELIPVGGKGLPVMPAS